MTRNIDTALMVSLVAALFIAFIAFSTTVSVHNGLGSADDAFFAMASKAVATGRGYGLPLSSIVTSPFEPSVGVGPSLILLGSAVTATIGPTDFLGLVTLGLFLVQLLFSALLLKRNHSSEQVLGFLLVSLLLLISASARFWSFGVFIGEAPAFGFLLVGAILLSTEQSPRQIAAAGVMFSLAFLTKQIALFGVAGIVLAWSAAVLLQRGLKFAMLRGALLGASLATLPACFELYKFLRLGWEGYQVLWRSTVDETSRMAIGSGVGTGRLATFLDIMRDQYWPLWLTVATVCVYWAFLVASKKKGAPRSRLFEYLMAGGLVYFLYIGFASTMFARYFWIGLAIVSFACGAVVLSVRPTSRWCLIGVALVVAFLVHPLEPLRGIYWGSKSGGTSAERAKVMSVLASYGPIPLVGRSWHSFYDLVYLRTPEGDWLTEGDLGTIHGRPFIAVLNAQFGDQTRYFHAVTASCPVVFTGVRYRLFTCDADFWFAYARTMQ